jgi:hypothetical protein
MSNFRSFKRCFFISLVLFCGYGSPTNAATINVVETLDAMQWATSSPLFGQNYLISQGDTVNLDITFANNEAIKVTSITSSGFLRFALRNTSGASYTINNVNVTLSDYLTDGSGSNLLTKASESSGSVQLGPFFIKSALGVAPGGFLQFSGFQASFLVSALTTSPTSYVGTFPGALTGLQWGVEVVSAVPVPAAVWLFGTALIGFVGMSRRRKVA